MKTEKAQNQIFALKFRIYPNKNGKAMLKRCFAASRKYWNHQVAAQTENLKTWNDRKEKWVKDGGEKHLQDLKDKMKKDLFNLRFQKINSQTTNTAINGETKRTIARLKTLIRGKIDA